MPSWAQQINFPQQAPPDTKPVYQMPRPAYDPLGTMLGSFLFTPSMSDTVAYDDNIFASEVRKDYDVVNTTSEEMAFASQWSRHFLNLDLVTDQQIYGLHSQEDANTYAARVSGRLDVTGTSFLQLDGIGSQQPDQRASPIALRTDQRPIYNNWGGSLSYFEQGSQFIEQFQIGVNQIDYLLPEYVYFNYTAKIIGDRVSLDLGGPLSPFLDAEYVINDQVFHPDRQSFRYLTGRIGVHAHVATVLDAEFAAGVFRETYLFTDFNTLVRPIVSANLLWNAAPLTSVIAKLERSYSGLESFCNTASLICQIGPTGNVEPAVVPVSPGAVLFETHRSTFEQTTVRLRVEHEIWNDLLGAVGVEYDRDVFDFNGLVDNEYTVGGNLRYLMNRYSEIQISYQYRDRIANLPNDFTFNSGPFTENILSVGLKLQL